MKDSEKQAIFDTIKRGDFVYVVVAAGVVRLQVKDVFTRSNLLSSKISLIEKGFTSLVLASSIGSVLFTSRVAAAKYIVESYTQIIESDALCQENIDWYRERIRRVILNTYKHRDSDKCI